MIARIALTLFVLSATSWSAFAGDGNIGGVAVKLPPPQGFCEMKDSEPSDARMLTAINKVLGGSGNQLLGISVECKQLTDWRTGARPLLDDMSQYQTPQNAPPNFSSDMISQVCAATRAQGEQMVSGMMPDVRKRVEDVMKEIKVNEMKFIGVLDEDKTACYTAILQRITTEIGTDKTQVAVNAITSVKGKPVFYYLFSVYKDENTASAMLAKHKVNVAALLAANK